MSKKITHRFRNRFCNKMCQDCRGFNNGKNTHCAWCGEELGYWNPLIKSKKKRDIVKENAELEKAQKKAEEEAKTKNKLYDWGF